MRIAFPMRIDALDKPGGDVGQVRSYIQAGNDLARNGDDGFSGEILTDPAADLSPFDVIHLTNLDRPVEAFHFFRNAQKLQKPTVFSTIHHSLREIRRYERQGRGGVAGRLTGLLDYNTLEALRSLVRLRRYPRLIRPTLTAIGFGLHRAQIEILKGTARILVLTLKEQTDTCSDFCALDAARFLCIRNGVELGSTTAPTVPAERDVAVCVVGRIEARKNQLAILRALNELKIVGVFLGAENPNHPGYCARFHRAIEASRSTFLGAGSHQDALAWMRRSLVHVSASWFEVASLVDIEASSAGCVVVSSQCGGTRELLGDRAIYVDPADYSSLKEGIRSALAQAVQLSHDNLARPGQEFPSWQQAARQLAGLYRAVLAEST